AQSRIEKTAIAHAIASATSNGRNSTFESFLATAVLAADLSIREYVHSSRIRRQMRCYRTQRIGQQVAARPMECRTVLQRSTRRMQGAKMRSSQSPAPRLTRTAHCLGRPGFGY